MNSNTPNHVYDEHPGQPPSQPERPSSNKSCGECPDQHHSLSHAYSTYLAHDTEEQTHWEDVCRSYRQYATFCMAQWANHQYRLHALPEDQRQFLPPSLRREAPEFQARAKLYKEAAIRNQFCLDCILRHAGQANSQDVIQQAGPPRTTGSSASSQFQHSTDAQMSKVSSVLKSLARDWSAEGKPERDMAYGPILAQVRRYLPPPPPLVVSKKRRKEPDANAAVSSSPMETEPTTTTPVRICVPGAGVGRLACELAALGYAVQGNEFSLYMLLASDFILNGGMGSPTHPLQISPYLLESRNVHGATDPLRPIAIPDVDPFQMMISPDDDDDDQEDLDTDSPLPQQEQDPKGSNDGLESSSVDLSTTSSSPSHSSHEQDELPPRNSQQQQPQPDFSMAAGEFVSIYGNARERERWDAFCCCFFIDTAPSIIEYLIVMHKCLKPGGFVFHFGPLLWHWSGPAMRPDDKTWDAYQSRYSYLDKKYLQSMDLSWQDVRAIFVNVGFEICEEKIGVHALYTADRRSMMNMSYHCVQFVARKKGGAPLPASATSGDLTGRTVQTVTSPVKTSPTTSPNKPTPIPAGSSSNPVPDADTTKSLTGNNDSSITPSSSISL